MQVETAVSLHFEATRDKVRPSDWRVETINPKTRGCFCGDLL